MSKIFVIGLSRTGTHSLAEALEILGYKSEHYPRILKLVWGIPVLDSKVFDQADAFADTPITAYYKVLDQRYPNSRFILTLRDKDSWLASAEKFFLHADEKAKRFKYLPSFMYPYLLPLFGLVKCVRNRKMSISAKKSRHLTQLLIRYRIYNSIRFNKQIFADAYDRHLEDVSTFFKYRPSSLLRINITKGEGWEKLCPFLKKPIPKTRFPHLDKAEKYNDLIAELGKTQTNRKEPGKAARP